MDFHRKKSRYRIECSTVGSGIALVGAYNVSAIAECKGHPQHKQTPQQHQILILISPTHVVCTM